MESSECTDGAARASESPQNASDQRLRKRPRVAMACQRCKARKQKCNGAQPSCASCLRKGIDCRYVVPTVSRGEKARLHVQRLEERVAELECGLSYGGRVEVAHDHWERLHVADDVGDPLSSAIRDASMVASGYYVGGTSYLTLGRLLGSALQFDYRSLANLDANAAPAHEEDENMSGRSSLATPAVAPPGKPEYDISDFSNSDCTMLFEAYMRYISQQLPLISSQKLRGIQARRCETEDPFEIALLHLVYAIGGICLELAGKRHTRLCDERFYAAMSFRDVVIGYIDRRSIIYLALASIFCQRAPRQPGPWTMIGLAIKLCISLGLHRKPSPTQFGLAAEFDKRLFWSCYVLDRDITIVAGRPPSISDRDIDTPLPLDVDENKVSLEEFNRAIRWQPGLPANPPTSLTHFIHSIRLKRIESAVQHEIYRVDKDVNASHDIVEDFLQQLLQWREAIITEPQPASQPAPSLGAAAAACCELWNAEHLQILRSIQYHSCVRFLLFPQLTTPGADDRFLKRCAAACASICESYKRLHDAVPACTFMPSDAQAIFIAGLCLIYCMWHTPEAMPVPVARNAITDCSIILYVVTERWRPNQRYRDTFERVKRTIFDHLAGGNHEPRVALELGGSETRSILHDLGQEFAGNAMWGLTHLFADISGEQLGSRSPGSHAPFAWTDITTLGGDFANEEYYSLAGPAPTQYYGTSVLFGPVSSCGGGV